MEHMYFSFVFSVLGAGCGGLWVLLIVCDTYVSVTSNRLYFLEQLHNFTYFSDESVGCQSPEIVTPHLL